MADVMVANWEAPSSLPGMNIDDMQLLASRGKGGLIVTFHEESRLLKAKSEKEKRPIFQTRILIRKFVPGDLSLEVVRPLRESDKDEFPMEWARWERTKQNTTPGIPIDNCYFMTNNQKAECKHLQIYTVEQFVNLSAANSGKILGYSGLKEKALLLIEAGKDQEVLAKAKLDSEERAAKLQEQLDSTNKKMAEMEAMLATLTAPKSK